jgi:hypothetical protein
VPAATKKEAENLVASQLVAWWILLPWREYPDVKPCVEALEAWFAKVFPTWQEGLRPPAAVPAALPHVLTAPLQVPGWMAGLVGAMGGLIVAGGLFAAGCSVSRGCRTRVKNLWRRITKPKPKPPAPQPAPPKGPDGKALPPWYILPLQHAIWASAAALVAGYGIKTLAKKIPKIPPFPDWIIPVGILGALGVWLWTRKKRR